MNMLFHQSVTEVKLWLRRRETVMFSLALPVMFLLFFGALYGHDKAPRGASFIQYIVPGYAVYAIMAVALGTISGNVANERQFLILKRLGGTPLPRATLLGAKIIAAGLLAGAVIVVEVIFSIVVYHVHLNGNLFSALLVLVVGILTFSAMGITLGGIAKAESSVAAGSLLYLALSFVGGVFVPLYQFPKGLREFAQYLPSERMVHALQGIWTMGDSLSAVREDVIVLAIWGVGALLVGMRRFRWE